MLEFAEHLSKIELESLKQIEFNEVLNKVQNYALSSLGAEIISKLYPVNDIQWLKSQHDYIEEMIKVLVSDDTMPLEGLDDIRNSLHKSLVENSILSTGEILKVRDNIRVFRLIKNYFNARMEEYPILMDLISGLHQNLLLEKHINDAIDETGEVKDTATRDLSRIRQSIREKSNRLRSRLQKIIKKVAEDDFIQEDWYTFREGRFVIPVKVEHKRHISGIIHGVSQTGSTVFLEPSEIIEMNNDISMLQSEEKREIAKILMNLSAEIGDEAKDFLRSVEILAHIDSILARAKYALEYEGVKPKIEEDNNIELINIRHPLLRHSKPKKQVIPLSISFDGKKRGHLISGPNAGGKTVALKSIGLNIAMALCGIYPLGQCHTNYRRIFTAIGDHQSIENDLSTFSSQILQLKHILDECDNESLVLVDEIGSGTDPQEGGALAAGILDSFIHMKTFFIATTHQSSLKTYALNRQEIENASLEFDEENLKPTYNFLSGVPGNSYAFVLAKNMGVSNLVLKRAKSYLGKKQQELEKSISILQKYRNEAEKIRRDTISEKEKAEKVRIKYDEKLDKLKTKQSEYLENAKQQASEIVDGANAIIENTIKEIREEKKAVSEIKKDFSEKKDKIKKKAEKKKEPKKNEIIELVHGDEVYMDDPTNTGYIINVYDDKTCLVEFNGLKFKLKLNQLTPVEKSQKKKQTETSDFIKFDTSNRIDIRGHRVDEAIRELDNYISEAILNTAINSINIIHGKGTGALKEAIHEYLANNHYIKSFRLGQLVEGGAGVTIAEL